MGFLINHIKSLFTGVMQMEGCKMAIIVRTDINMGKGKVAAQCAHAALECYRQALTSKKNQELLTSWINVGQPKIVLKIASESDLLEIAHNAQLSGLVTAVIRDAGKTQLHPGTLSVVGIGPGPKVVVEHVTSNLKLL